MTYSLINLIWEGIDPRREIKVKACKQIVPSEIQVFDFRRIMKFIEHNSQVRVLFLAE